MAEFDQFRSDDPMEQEDIQISEVFAIDNVTSAKLILRGIGNAIRPMRMIRDLRAINQSQLPWEVEG